MAPVTRHPSPPHESVWDYPRPPRVEPTTKQIRVVFNGITIADTRRAQRVLETSHPPVYYIPPEDIRIEYFKSTPRRSFCEYKGSARYHTITVNNKSAGSKTANNAAWSYPNPAPAYQSIQNHIAFYPSLMDACYVDDEPVTPQPGDFYGGWITKNITGPFKGDPNTSNW